VSETIPVTASHDGDRPPEPASAAEATATADSGGRFPVAFTPDPGVRLRPGARWVEGDRPAGPALEPGLTYTAQDLASSRQLVAVHDHLRAELDQVRDLIGQVLDGSLPPTDARSRISEMTMRQNSWTVGAYCAAYCRVVTTHHTIEDQALFPRLRRADLRLTPVVDRLHYEHEIIHEVLEEVDRALVDFVGADGDGRGLQAAVDALTDTLLSHLSYEERELLEPIARLGVLV
jgi:hypothetical protein